MSVEQQTHSSRVEHGTVEGTQLAVPCSGFVSAAIASVALTVSDPVLAQTAPARGTTQAAANGNADTDRAQPRDAVPATSTGTAASASARASQRPSGRSQAGALTQSAATFRANGELAQPQYVQERCAEPLSAAGWQPFNRSDERPSEFQRQIDVLLLQIEDRRRHDAEMKDRQRERRHEAEQLEADRAFERERLTRSENERERERNARSEEAARERNARSEEAKRQYERDREMDSLDHAQEKEMARLRACLEQSLQSHQAEFDRQAADAAAQRAAQEKRIDRIYKGRS